MKEKVRLDKLLVLKNHVENVSKAKALIMSGKVIVNEIKIEKPGTKFTTSINIRIKKKPYNWVSRGGVKLDYAIKQLGLELENKICADIGSSTGGFTDVLLSRNVAHVYSIDVGKGLLDWKILKNGKVTMLDKTNSRKIILEDIHPEISFVTCDLSFISLTKGLEKIVETNNKNVSILALIKPQFELTKEMIGKKGIVTNSDYRKTAIIKVSNWFHEKGWVRKNLIESPIKGTKGNKEYFIYCEK